MVTTKAGAGTGTRVIKLPRNRLAEAAGVLAQAFQDDPIQRYVTPNDARRAHQLPWTFGAAVRYCFPHGAVYSTPHLDGIACWLPPGSSLTNARGMLRSGKIFAPVWLGPAAFTRFMGVAAYMTAARARIMPLPHWYLLALGVEPARQGGGIGAALLTPVLAQADASGLPCYLETQLERNVRFYEKCGFAVTSVGEPHDLRVWTMRRPPQG